MKRQKIQTIEINISMVLYNIEINMLTQYPEGQIHLLLAWI